VTLGALLARISAKLDDAGIAYMITGSVASSFHGEPRATRDLDIVIDPTPDAIRRLVRSLPADEFYTDLDAALEALRQRSQFNVVEVATGWKVDLLVRKDRPFSREEFARRQRADLQGVSAYVATAEDTIIAKLEWARSGESERQLRDVAGILAASGDRIDHAYLKQWIKELGLSELWARVEDAG